MRSLYGVTRVATVPTGVDIEYFQPPGPVAIEYDLVFLGSMDWMPNIDGMLWFVREVLPIIARKRPDCRVAIVGRKPTAEVRRLAESNPNITVTGTVDDVRPWLWKSHASIVPLRIGGGTRLKIYEAMAARVPVVSTAIGAEGLDVRDGSDIRIADQPEAFADACLELLASTEARARMAEAAWTLVSERFSWDVVTRRFEELLIA
jgi:glycosyltransferase involved in cell wall biosynthesis